MRKVSIIVVCIALFYGLLPLKLLGQNNVGVGTTTPDPSAILDLSASDKGLLVPRMTAAQRLMIANPVDGLLVYDKDSLCLFYYKVPPFPSPPGWLSLCHTQHTGPASISLDTDAEISTYDLMDVPHMLLSFTAARPTAFLLLTASGYGYTEAMSYVQFTVINITTNDTIGGTIDKIQNYDQGIGTVTTWSCSFSKMLTGLTIGNVYTLKVMGRVDGVYGIYDAIIDMTNYPQGCHMTMTVFP